MAQIALRKTAQENKASYPEAAEVLTNNTYMDDICESVDTEKEARKFTNDIDTVLKMGGFKVKDWISNKMLKEKVNGDVEKEINMFKADEEKVLGTLWNFKTDKFHFRVADDQKNDPESSGSHLGSDWICSSILCQNKDRNAKTVAAGAGLG